MVAIGVAAGLSDGFIRRIQTENNSGAHLRAMQGKRS